MYIHIFQRLFESRWARTALIAILAVGMVGWYLRIPGRNNDSVDFTGPYAQTRLWIEGQDPYNEELFAPMFPADIAVITPPAYPPTIFAIVAPYAALDWLDAKFVWKYTLLALQFATAAVLIRWAGLSRNIPQMLTFLCIVAMFSPTVSAICNGQLAYFSVAMIIFGLYVHTKGLPWLAGIAVGLAACAKPQLGGPVLLYLAVMPRRSSLISAVATGAIVGLIGVIPFVLNGNSTGWVFDWLAAASSMQGLDAAVDNPYRRGRVDLPVLLHEFIGNRHAVQFISIGVVSLGLGVWIWLVRRITIQDARDAMLAVSPLLALLPLPMYHRIYDTNLMLIPFAWACSQLFTGRHVKVAIAMMVIAFQLCFPWNLYLFVLLEKGLIPENVTGYFAWSLIVECLQTWLILAMAGLSMWVLVREAQVNRYDDVLPAFI